jgi:hypothetical protein
VFWTGVFNSSGPLPATPNCPYCQVSLPKLGLIGAPVAGELYLADISVPAIVYRRPGLTPPHLFRNDDYVRLS